MFPPRLELRTFRVLGERDNHYTTGTDVYFVCISLYQSKDYAQRIYCILQSALKLNQDSKLYHSWMINMIINL